MGSVPVGHIPMGSVPVASVPLGSTRSPSRDPGCTSLGSILTGSLPMGSLPSGSISIAAVPVGSIPTGHVPIGSALPSHTCPRGLSFPPTQGGDSCWGPVWEPLGRPGEGEEHGFTPVLPAGSHSQLSSCLRNTAGSGGEALSGSTRDLTVAIASVARPRPPRVGNSVPAPQQVETPRGISSATW